MQRSSVINLAHSYDLPNVDATFDLVPTVDGAARRLKVWRAHGAKDRLRVAEYSQRPGEPEFPAGDVRYLCINRDVVIPIYAITEYRTNEWNVEVRYDEGGEPDIYQFQSKQDALGFQSLVTGYDVPCCFENVGIYLTHRRHKLAVVNALRLRGHPELAASGEIQFWQRPLLTRSVRVNSSVQPDRPLSQTTINGHTSRQLSDNLSLHADSSTGQQFYINDHLPAPLLVVFAKESNGDYIMLKMNLPTLQTKVFGNSIVLRPRERDFIVKQLTVTSSGLAQWNVCSMGTYAKAPALESLVCTSLTLETRPGAAEIVDEEILELQRDYAKVQLQGDRARAATIRNEEVPAPGGVGTRKTSGSTGSSSSSATVSLVQPPGRVLRNYDATTGYTQPSRRSYLPSLRSYESLNGMFVRELDRGQGPAQLDCTTRTVPAAAELESNLETRQTRLGGS